MDLAANVDNLIAKYEQYIFDNGGTPQEVEQYQKLVEDRISNFSIFLDFETDKPRLSHYLKRDCKDKELSPLVEKAYIELCCEIKEVTYKWFEEQEKGKHE